MNKCTHAITSLMAAMTVACSAFSAHADEATTPTVETNQPPKWDASASLGFSLASGNSDTLLLTADAIGKRKFDDASLELGIVGSYGENGGDRTVQTLRGWGQYDDLFSKRTYWYGRIEGLHDGISDIEYRFTLSPGLGYYLVKKEKTSLKGEAGPAFIYERKGNVNNGYFALRFAERFEHEFNDRVKVYQGVEYLPQIDEWNDYLINFVLGIETAMSDKLSLAVTLLDNYVSQPAAGRVHNDIRLITSVKYKF